MKTLIFCTCFVNNDIDGSKVFRYQKWIRYYSPILEDLGADTIFLIDDGSDVESLREIAGSPIAEAGGKLPDRLAGKVNIFRFDEHLGRSSIMDYPGWWRSFTYSVVLAEKYGFDRIIHIESDLYIISAALKDFIRGINSGWAALFCQTYNWPETAIQVICRDSYSSLKQISDWVQVNNYVPGREAEYALPFTRVCKDFMGDRLGEYMVVKKWAGMVGSEVEFDYIAQLPTRLKPPSAVQLRDLVLTFKDMSSGDDLEDNRMLLELMSSILE